jgi:hypothetical protein
MMLASWLAMTHLLATQSVALPINLQVALFKKIIQYDTFFQGRNLGDIGVLILDGSDELTRTFVQGGLAAKRVSARELPQEIGSASVVYVPSGVDPGAVTRLCPEHSVLSLAARAELAERGEVSIGAGVRPDGKPKIVVNLTRLKAEGHSLPAGVLSLASVVR